MVGAAGGTAIPSEGGRTCAAVAAVPAAVPVAAAEAAGTAIVRIAAGTAWISVRTAALYSRQGFSLNRSSRIDSSQVHMHLMTLSLVKD